MSCVQVPQKSLNTFLIMFFAYRLNIRKIFPLYLPFTLDIASLYNHRTNFERPPKYKLLIPH